MTIGTDEKGRPVRRTKSGFKTKTEALAYLTSLKDDSPKPDTATSMHQVFTEMMQRRDVSTSTQNCYLAAYKYFSPLHAVPFRQIGVDDWQRCIDECPQGRRTQENMRALVSLLYKYAIPRGLVNTELMTFRGEFLRIPTKAESAHKEGFSPEELTILWEHSDDPIVATILVMCHTGFRLGEYLNVRYENHALIGGSKTEAGRNRRVPLPQNIEELWIRSRKFDNEKEFRKSFYAALEALGIENENHRLTPHSTRHTFATLLKDAPGADKDKMALIGHNSTEMLRYYQDSRDAERLKIMETIAHSLHT